MILTDTDLVASALHWDLSYLEQNMGPAKHTVYVSKTQTFMYFDDRKVSIITYTCIMSVLSTCTVVLLFYCYIPQYSTTDMGSSTSECA